MGDHVIHFSSRSSLWLSGWVSSSACGEDCGPGGHVATSGVQLYQLDEATRTFPLLGKAVLFQSWE